MSETRYIPCPLSQAAREMGDAPALLSATRTYTFRDLDTLVSGYACALRAHYVCSGDRVAIKSPNSPELLAIILACIRVGATACPISTRLPDGAIEETLGTLSPKLFIASDDERETSSTWVTMDDLQSDLRPPTCDVEEIDMDQWATIIFTSGSSGKPKAAVHRYANHFGSATASNKNIAVRPGDTWLLSLPLYHVGGLAIVFRCILGRAAVAIASAGETLEDSLTRFTPTHVSMVSTQLFRLLDKPLAREALSKLKAILLGGGAMPESLIREAVERKLPIYTSYGLTEMATQVTATAPHDTPEHLSTSGKPLFNDSIHISDEGEICVGGDTLFEGYLEGDEAILPLTVDGFFATGDLGRFDDDGYLRVTGRADNRFISGGENIQPEMIEDRLCRTTDILEAIVVAIPDAEFGHRPVAFIRCESDWSEAEIRDELSRDLPGFMVPDAIHPWPHQLTAQGMKVDRAAFTRYAEQL